MIGLKEYREFWQEAATRLDGVRSVLPVVIDEEMGKKIQALKGSDLPALFWAPPMAESTEAADADTLAERNTCVVYVMTRYDPLKSSSLEALEETQPAIEALKRLLTGEYSGRCGVINLDPTTFSTMPETRFYRNFAGWSLGFTCDT